MSEKLRHVQAIFYLSNDLLRSLRSLFEEIISRADAGGAGESVADVPVSVSDSALPAVSFRVVAQVTRVYLPLARR